MKKESKMFYIVGLASILLALVGITVLMCAGFMVESGSFSTVIKTMACGALMCVPMVVFYKIDERR